MLLYATLWDLLSATPLEFLILGYFYLAGTLSPTSPLSACLSIGMGLGCVVFSWAQSLGRLHLRVS